MVIGYTHRKVGSKYYIYERDSEKPTRKLDGHVYENEQRAIMAVAELNFGMIGWSVKDVMGMINNPVV